jgi:hypothetical protein
MCFNPVSSKSIQLYSRANRANLHVNVREGAKTVKAWSKNVIGATAISQMRNNENEFVILRVRNKRKQAPFSI